MVGKFVEFFGGGLKNLSLADRATIANMAPEYGATCGFFPIDDETLRYLRFSGRDEHTVKIVEKYAKEQRVWSSDNIKFTDKISLDMSTVVPTISGPKRPQDKVLLTDASSNFKKEENNNNEPLIFAELNTEIEELTVVDALENMKLGNISALMFRNKKHSGLNMIYKREDGLIGWVDPRGNRDLAKV